MQAHVHLPFLYTTTTTLMMITELMLETSLWPAHFLQMQKNSKCSAISGPHGSHYACGVLMDTIVLLRLLKMTSLMDQQQLSTHDKMFLPFTPI